MQAESGPDLSSHILIENTRKVIKDAFRDLGFALNRKRSPSLVITHDVDTARGLEYAHELKAVEARLNLSSIWFLVTEAYDLDARLLRDLADGSTIGSHDTKHDGKLIQIHNKNDLVKRLKRSRSKLESIIDKPVDSFRSPLLQFSAEILSGLAEANYKKDFSAPTWEPSHPSTMSGFGVETVQPFEIGGILEVPLTLTQDHQVMNVLGLNTREATKFWVQQARFVRSIDGDIVLLVHPDYDFAQHPEDYQTLLEQLVSVNAEYTESS
jgi:hypothetical protein